MSGFINYLDNKMIKSVPRKKNFQPTKPFNKKENISFDENSEVFNRLVEEVYKRVVKELKPIKKFVPNKPVVENKSNKLNRRESIGSKVRDILEGVSDSKVAPKFGNLVQERTTQEGSGMSMGVDEHGDPVLIKPVKKLTGDAKKAASLLF